LKCEDVKRVHKHARPCRCYTRGE